jgi:hypothetical protein
MSLLKPGPSELQHVLEAYLLPELPEADESLDPSTDDYAAAPRDLILRREHDDSILLREYVPLEDAKEYCQREDTHGDGWFVGFDRT